MTGLSPEDARAFVRTAYGVAARTQLLSSERDQNFLIEGDTGKYVLKITNPAEDRSVTNFQTAALLHVAAVDPGLAVPRLVPDRHGYREHVFAPDGGQQRVARLLTFLPGVLGTMAPPSPALRQSIGKMLARFDRALAGFAHPAQDHELSWDIMHVGRLRPMLSEIDDPSRRERVCSILDHFDSSTAPALAPLRRQVIHNDLSLFNVLVDETAPTEVTGILDFGDMVRAPLINELAVAASYHFSAVGEPLSPVIDLIRAYHEILPLYPAETDLLHDLIATRQAMTILITESRAKRHPENRDYILKNHPAAVLGLKRLEEIQREEAQRLLRRALGMEH